MERQENHKLGKGWDRPQLSLRLTPERKVELLALCKELGPEPTPTDAIDRALSLARHAKWTDIESDSGASLESTLESKFNGFQAALDRQARHTEQLTASMRGLHKLISSIAESPDSDGLPLVDIPSHGPMSFRAWLDGTLQVAGLKARRVAIVHSTWQRKVNAMPRMATLDLTAELIAVDGAMVARGPAYPEACRLDLIDTAHPICAVELPCPMFLVCQVLENGWMAHAHRVTADGKPGEAIGSHRI